MEVVGGTSVVALRATANALNIESLDRMTSAYEAHHLAQQQLYLSIRQSLLREKATFGFVILVYDLGRAQKVLRSDQELRAVGCRRRRR
jgi:hypothetical protein